MPAAVRMRSDFSAGELRRLAATTKNANQSRRMLSLAAVLDGMSRAEAARMGGMDRQTLRDWVHRFNERGPDGLKSGAGSATGITLPIVFFALARRLKYLLLSASPSRSPPVSPRPREDPRAPPEAPRTIWFFRRLN